MIRDLLRRAAALARRPARRRVVCIRGQGREGSFGAFCAGGDIRFFHQAGTGRRPRALEDFFTEEYAAQPPDPHLPQALYRLHGRHRVMGGGMGISQGAKLRIVTERTKMAMPETNHRPVPGRRRRLFPERAAPATPASTWR
jgi:enoyl-CoA hydratase/carnithine racemase